MGFGPAQVSRAMALATGVALLTGSVVLSGHHLPDESAPQSEPEPKALKILTVSPDNHVMLVGGSRVLNIEICNEDGSGCRPAKNAKPKVQPKEGLKHSGRKGAQLKVTGNKPGVYEITFKQGDAVGMTTITINEPPNREPSGPSGDEYRVYISPDETYLSEGQSAMFMVWGCLLGPDGRLGLNELPDGIDDDCIELDIEELNWDETLPIGVLGPDGSRFMVTVETLPEDFEGDATFAGVQAVTEFGGTLASIIARRAAELDEFIESGKFVGDTNGNGVWDEGDWGELWMVMFGGRYDPRFDVDENGILDAADWDALTGGQPGMPTPPPMREEPPAEESTG